MPCRESYAASVRFYSEAFVANAKLANVLDGGDPYAAGRAAALAGCGQVRMPPTCSLTSTLAFVSGGVSWLRADLQGGPACGVRAGIGEAA